MKIRIPIPDGTIINEDIAAEVTKDFLNKLIANGAIEGSISDILKDYSVNYQNNFVIVEIDDDSYVDGSKFNSIGASPVFENEFEAKDYKVDISKYNKYFSVTTINERLRLMNKPPKMQLKLIINDYKKYYKSKSEQLNSKSDEFKKLKSLFVYDLMGLFNVILPEIQEGKQLGTLLGISNISPNLNKLASKLSIAYKLALKTEQKSGAPSKDQFVKLSNYYKQFVDELVNLVFNDTSKTFSDTVDDIQSNRVNTNLPDGQYFGTYDDFVVKLNDGTVLSFNSSSYGDTEFDAVIEVKDGIAELNRRDEYEYQYNKLSDGRIDLFSEPKLVHK